MRRRCGRRSAARRSWRLVPSTALAEHPRRSAGDWRPLGGPVGARLATVRSHDGRIEVFALTDKILQRTTTRSTQPAPGAPGRTSAAEVTSSRPCATVTDGWRSSPTTPAVSTTAGSTSPAATGATGSLLTASCNSGFAVTVMRWPRGPGCTAGAHASGCPGRVCSGADQWTRCAPQMGCQFGVLLVHPAQGVTDAGRDVLAGAFARIAQSAGPAAQACAPAQFLQQSRRSWS